MIHGGGGVIRHSYIGQDFDIFGDALTGYPKKSIEEMHGPTISLQEQYLKRVKKKKIEIVNRSQVACAT